MRPSATMSLSALKKSLHPAQTLPLLHAHTAVTHCAHAPVAALTLPCEAGPRVRPAHTPPLAAVPQPGTIAAPARLLRRPERTACARPVLGHGLCGGGKHDPSPGGQQKSSCRPSQSHETFCFVAITIQDSAASRLLPGSRYSCNTHNLHTSNVEHTPSPMFWTFSTSHIRMVCAPHGLCRYRKKTCKRASTLMPLELSSAVVAYAAPSRPAWIMSATIKPSSNSSVARTVLNYLAVSPVMSPDARVLKCAIEVHDTGALSEITSKQN
jgi:hypothetical protein